tara:strand:- start:1097 stop:1753 length:657 start_codon:yes stop_codon:yes gene_type:complete
MKKLVIIILIIVFSCNKKDNLIIEGEIIGVKNSNIYLLITDEGIIIDSTNIIDGKFNLKTYLDEPKEMSLILKNKDSENKFNFISEPANILFTSSKDKFVFNGKITNSKIYSDFKNLENQLNSFNDRDLEMLVDQIKISTKGNLNKYDSINDLRLKLNQKKLLFIVNYAINNNANILSAFISYKYRKEIRKKYLEKIYKNLSNEVRDSYYGIKLSSIL